MCLEKSAARIEVRPSFHEKLEPVRMLRLIMQIGVNQYKYVMYSYISFKFTHTNNKYELSDVDPAKLLMYKYIPRIFSTEINHEKININDDIKQMNAVLLNVI